MPINYSELPPAASGVAPGPAYPSATAIPPSGEVYGSYNIPQPAPYVPPPWVMPPSSQPYQWHPSQGGTLGRIASHMPGVPAYLAGQQIFLGGQAVSNWLSNLLGKLYGGGKQSTNVFDYLTPRTPQTPGNIAPGFELPEASEAAQQQQFQYPFTSSPPAAGSYGIGGQGGSYFTQSGPGGFDIPGGIPFNPGAQGMNVFDYFRGATTRPHVPAPMSKELYSGLMKGSGWAQLLYPKGGAPSYRDYLASWAGVIPRVMPANQPAPDRGDLLLGWGLRHAGQTAQPK